VSRIDHLIAELCPDGVEFKTLGAVGEFIRAEDSPRMTSFPMLSAAFTTVRYTLTTARQRHPCFLMCAPIWHHTCASPGMEI
jgi:hypothetical protein